MARHPAIALALAALFAQATTAPAAEKDAKAHLGRWEALGYEEKGKRPTTASLIWDVRPDGTILTEIPKLKSKGVWKYSNDSSKEPMEIDLSLTEGRLAGKILRGIYKVEGGILTVCYPKGNVPDVERVPRPTAFDVSRRTDIQILRLKRIGDVGPVVGKPDPKDLHAVVFTALSDDFTVNGRAAAGKRDPLDLVGALASADRELAALAASAVKIIFKRNEVKVATAVWRHSAKTPGGIRLEMMRKVVDEARRPIAPEDRNLTDDLLVLLTKSKPNEARIAATVEMLEELRKAQTGTLPPVLRSRFPKASVDGGSVAMSVKMEPGKLPAEMTLTNTGTKPLRNAVVWYRIEMGPIPGLTAEEVDGLALAFAAGAHRAVFARWTSKKAQDQALAQGSRNIVFIPELKPKESARITYELGTIRWSKKAEFSLWSEELKVEGKEIAGVKEMKAQIERMFGGKK